MEESDVLILAGGLGTRLRTIVKDIPKPMALIKGKPFLEYILKFLQKKGVKKVILSVGYKKESIISYFGNKYLDINIKYAIEEKPLGTGGAILNALELIDSKNFFILNGDTYFDISFNMMKNFYESNDADLVIALKYLNNSQRYGKVIINRKFRIIGFIEKGEQSEGFINGGIYLIKKSILESLSFPEIFSFEKDFLEKYYKEFKFYGLPFDSYFIDIGVPEDYERAQFEIS